MLSFAEINTDFSVFLIKHGIVVIRRLRAVFINGKITENSVY